MIKLIDEFRTSIAYKVILTWGLTFIIISSLSYYFMIRQQEENVITAGVNEILRLGDTITLGTYYAMLTDSKEDIQEIVKNVGKLDEISNIRIYNQHGQIKFSNIPDEIDEYADMADPKCAVCHASDPPLFQLDASERTLMMASPDGGKLVGIITPVYNEPNCATGQCHAHDPSTKILGFLDVAVSLDRMSNQVAIFKRDALRHATFLSLATIIALFVVIQIIIKKPIKKLIAKTARIASGDEAAAADVDQNDELGQLAAATNEMGRKIREHHAALLKERERYQKLFESAPCLITVQNRNLEIISYNASFGENFDVRPGDYCHDVYRKRSEKCPDCIVEKTFDEKRSFTTEHAGFDKEGREVHWIMTTAPVADATGAVDAVMQMSVDITSRKELEEKLRESENKYSAIFSNIPNSVFVLNSETHEILDCNRSMTKIYGYEREDILGRPFTDLFPPEDKTAGGQALSAMQPLNKTKNIRKDGGAIIVDVSASPATYGDADVLLVTTTDVTKNFELEQQLIQAGKMTTLGEMSTAVAHELNQPLASIQLISNLFTSKIKKKEAIDEKTLTMMADGISRNIERSTNIINHMREFGHKPGLEPVPVQLNAVMERAFGLFQQQLAVRNIEVAWDLEADLPPIMADANRLEQVFINLLINARDAVQEKWGAGGKAAGKKIALKSHSTRKQVIAEVCDNGPGVPSEMKNKLFEPFFTTKEVGKGTGLGLSISYGIVTEYNGRIMVKNNKDGGACFIMMFPASACR